MQRCSIRKLVAGLALALAAGLAGCREEGAPLQAGVARVVVRAAGETAGIARVILKVSKGDGPDFTPFSAELQRSGRQWMGRIENVPAGPSRRFEVAAYDAAGGEQMTGGASADVLARAATVVAITISPSTGQADVRVRQNSYPVIRALRAEFRTGATVEGDLAVDAVDPDGDPLSFDWSSGAPGGCAGIVFRSTGLPGRTHVSLPFSAAACKVQVTVSDHRAAGGTVASLLLPAGTPAAPSTDAWR